MKLCFVCSSGGHFSELYSLKELIEERDSFWVTFDSLDTRSSLMGQKTYFAYSPTNRNIKNLIRNFFVAFRILRKEKPDVIISMGAGVAVPFIILGKLFRIKTLYIESLTRTCDLSLTGKLVYRFTDDFFVQWPELAQKYPKAIYEGQVI